jgi:hypothetical protein
MRSILLALLLAPLPAALHAQIRVNPNGVNVNTQGATTVFLTYGGISGYSATEALWCGELMPATPAIGLRCTPGSIFGQLPIRYEHSTASGTNAFTDIMTIPASVSRRAYQAAENGNNSAFYYVRRFRRAGSPDQYVAVTCRLSGGGARSPLSLTDVRIAFAPEAPVLHVAQGEPLPALEATITYTGTGRLTGRWEIVLPGEELPTEEDLLTEATLPLGKRGTQRRYTQLARFNEFLPPVGRVVLPGPDPDRLPTTADGIYYLLLRIEATTEKEGDSNLAAAGAGTGVVPGGAVAGFPMPVLRYIVGSGETIEKIDARATLQLLAPGVNAALDSTSTIFTWQAFAQAALYTVEFETDNAQPILSALVPATIAAYRAPPWFSERVAGRPFRWRVVATDLAGRVLGRSAWRSATLR